MQSASIRAVRTLGVVATLGAALAASLFVAAPARAAVAEQAAADCLRYFELTVKKAQSSTAAAAADAVKRIKNYDAAGAGDSELMGIATRGKRNVNSAAGECSMGISSRGQQCISQLTAQKASPTLIHEVMKSRAKALDQVATAAAAQKKAVDTALSAALAD